MTCYKLKVVSRCSDTSIKSTAARELADMSLKPIIHVHAIHIIHVAEVQPSKNIVFISIQTSTSKSSHPISTCTSKVNVHRIRAIHTQISKSSSIGRQIELRLLLHCDSRVLLRTRCHRIKHLLHIWRGQLCRKVGQRDGTNGRLGFDAAMKANDRLGESCVLLDNVHRTLVFEC